MIYAIVPLVVAIACLWLGRRLATALLILFYLSIEGFLKLMSNYNRVVHVGLDIIVLLLAGYFVLQAVVERRAHLDELPYTKLILVYAVWMVLQLLNPFSPGLLQSIAAFKVHLTMVPLYFIAATLFREPRDLIKFVFGLTLIVFVPYVMSLVQYALGPSSVLDLSPRFWANISYYHDWRPFGTSAVPGGSSVMAFLVTPLTIALLVAPGVRKTIKPIALISILLAAGTFVVSGVRQVFLGCVFAILVMGALMLMRRSGRIFVVVALVAVLGFGGYVGVATYLRPMAKEAIAQLLSLWSAWSSSPGRTRLPKAVRGWAAVFRQRFSPIIILTTRRASKAKLKQLATLADEVKVCGGREIDFQAALRWLREKWKVKRVLCEGGGELNSALFAAGLVNEHHLTVCPKIFGGRHAPTVADGLGAATLADATRLQLKSTRRIGDELFLVYRVVHATKPKPRAASRRKVSSE